MKGAGYGGGGGVIGTGRGTYDVQVGVPMMYR